MILQNGCNLNWLQPFLYSFLIVCTMMHTAISVGTFLTAPAQNTPTIVVTGGKTASAGTIAKRAATRALASVMRSGASAIIRGLFGNKKK